jgi:hypothetical protein
LIASFVFNGAIISLAEADREGKETKQDRVAIVPLDVIESRMMDESAMRELL